jgi:transposase InsO family protein
VSHRRAKLTPLGRRLLVGRILEDGWSVSAAAGSMGVSRTTAYKWLARFRDQGTEGLLDRSSAPMRRPRALPARDVRRIVSARRRLKLGTDRLGPALGYPPSTVYGVLRRQGLSRLAHLDRPTAIPVRYERARPGELVHVDVKKLGKIRAGGGWKMRGRSHETRHDSSAFGEIGYDYLHVAIDDHSRYAYAELLPNERGDTCAAFLSRACEHLRTRGVAVERVMTDNARNYVCSSAFQAVLTAVGARHVLTRPYRPQTNGKAERFNRTALEEWAYARLYRSNEARAIALSRWLETYNRTRPHTALGGLPPVSRMPTT